MISFFSQLKICIINFEQATYEYKFIVSKPKLLNMRICVLQRNRLVMIILLSYIAKITWSNHESKVILSQKKDYLIEVSFFWYKADFLKNKK